MITDRFPDPIDAKIEVRQVPVGEIPADMQSLDIGDQTRALYAQAIKGAKRSSGTDRWAYLKIPSWRAAP